MRTFLLLVLLLLVTGHPLSISEEGEKEEFYIVTSAPVAVGGGLIRHYLGSGGRLVSVRYSYGGEDADTLFVKKFTRSSRDNSSTRETISIPLEKYRRQKAGILQVGSHKVRLRLTENGRVTVEEIKD